MEFDRRDQPARDARDTTNQGNADVDQTSAEQQTDPEEQKRLWQLYQQQQRRLNCPGCGEEPFFG